MSRNVWTLSDEENFQKLSRRREEIGRANEMPVSEIVADLIRVIDSNQHNAPGKQAVEFMKVHADRIRDALEPYDSGVRPADTA